ncbi:MAG: arginine deiminase-related protein, partial [Planctomycetota bacterium]
MPPACLCILPARFGVHEATAATNAYVRTPEADSAVVAQRGRGEAEALVAALRSAGVDALALDERDRGVDPCPDAVFPNNWFVVHDRTLVLCPMLNELRRRERWGGFRAHLEGAGVAIDRVIDMACHERDGLALEGTGSLVFDRAQRAVYAARSARTDEGLA